MEITLQMMQTKADETVQQIAAIKEQIARAKADVHNTGKYSDTDWFQSANRALRHKQADHQLLLREIGIKNKEKKKKAQALNEASQKCYERNFIRAARVLLDEQTYMSIVAEAKLHADKP